MRTSVYALDIGVYEVGVQGQILARTTTAWCRLTSGVRSFDLLEYSGTPCRGAFKERGTNESMPIPCGRSIPDLAQRIATDLSNGARVALGFEAPMWLPVATVHRPRLDLFRPRCPGEKGHAWYLQSGAAASLKAVTLAVLLFAEIRGRCKGGRSWSTHVDGWEPGRLMLYEAFVAGAYKVTDVAAAMDAPDEWDALTAALAWGGRHAGFEVPEGYDAVSLHEAGSQSGPAISLWSTVDPKAEIVGPPDCEVVALEKEK